MWRSLKSSVVMPSSSLSFRGGGGGGVNVNNDPPASNRNDPDEDAGGAVIVMDYPLHYSNVASSSSSAQEADMAGAISATAADNRVDDEEEGLMVVPAADTAAADDAKDTSSDLSINPGQLTDSLLEAALQKFDDTNKQGEEEEDEQQQSQRGNDEILSSNDDGDDDDKENQGLRGSDIMDELDDEEEGILVDEPLAAEEEALLAELTAEPHFRSRNTTHTQEEDALLAELVAETTMVANENTIEEFGPTPTRVNSSTTSTATKNDVAGVAAKEPVMDNPFAIKSEHPLGGGDAGFLQVEPLDDYAKVMMRAWRGYILVTAIIGFCMLFFSGDAKNGVVGHATGMAQDLAAASLSFTMDSGSIYCPTLMSTPLAMAPPPFAAPLLEKNGNGENMTVPIKVTETMESEVDDTWATNVEGLFEDTIDFFRIAVWLLALILLILCVRLLLDDENPNETNGTGTLTVRGSPTMTVRNQMVSLNSFEGLLWFHKNFVKSNKGRRVASRVKFDMDAYNKLTRLELLQILDGFGRYSGRKAAKMTLICDLCVVYRQALHRLTFPQIVEILEAKGYSVNGNMKKNELIGLALRVGF